MKRLHLFEFCDQAWFPQSIRQAGLEYLAHVIRVMKVYESTKPVLTELAKSANTNRVVVLGAGAGGGILDLLQSLPVNEIILTDLFPDRQFSQNSTRLYYYQEAVDALKVPQNLNGARVMYTAFHHFRPEQAKAILAAAVRDRQPIAIFEATERSLRGLLSALLVPLLVLLMTPWIRPFRWSRLLWTYVIPAIPLGALWDGMVSSLRSYTPEELKAMTTQMPSYQWDIGAIKGAYYGAPITYLTGNPIS